MNKSCEIPDGVFIGSSEEKKLTKLEKDTLDYIFLTNRHIHFASDNFEMMDYLSFITPSKDGYRVSHLEFTHSGFTNYGIYDLNLITSVDVNNLDESLEVIKTIFGEDSSISCGESLESESDVTEWYRNRDDIVIGVLLTRFKDSNNWLEFFIEGNELEIAFHNEFDTCLDHILCYYGC